jgi:Zn-finger protein
MRALVEQCQRININELLRTVEAESKQITLRAKFEVLGVRIETTSTPCHFGGKRLWFICPFCKRRVGTLYKPPAKDELLCRKCHGLGYSRSRYKGMVEGITFSLK